MSVTELVAVCSSGLLHLHRGHLLQLAVHIQGTTESELHFCVSTCPSAWLPVITATDWPGGLGTNNAVFPVTKTNLDAACIPETGNWNTVLCVCVGTSLQGCSKGNGLTAGLPCAPRELGRRSSLEKIRRRLRLRLDAQPQVIDTDGSHRSCVSCKSHQSRHLLPAQNPAMGFSRVLSKNGQNGFGCLH